MRTFSLRDLEGGLDLALHQGRKTDPADEVEDAEEEYMHAIDSPENRTRKADTAEIHREDEQQDLGNRCTGDKMKNAG